MIRFGIITVSDRSSKGAREDRSGPVLADIIRTNEWKVVKMAILPDEFDELTARIREWADSGEIDVLVTTGGTGLSPRDVTPEATLAVIERHVPGIAETMRARSLDITPYAMLSRGVVGTRGVTLIVNLPGSPKGAQEHLEVILPILPHAVALIRDDPSAGEGHSELTNG